MGVIQVARQLPRWLWWMWCSGRGRWKYQGCVWRAFVCEVPMPVMSGIGMECVYLMWKGWGWGVDASAPC